MRSFLRAALTLVSVVIFAGCSGSTSPEQQATLTREDAMRLLEFLGGSFSVSSTGTLNSSSSSALFLISSAIPIDLTVSCPEGGTVRIVGAMIINDDFSLSSSSYVATYSSCGFGSFVIGKSLQVEGEGRRTDDNYIVTQRIGGTISVVTSGSSVDCVWDIVEDNILNHSTNSFSVVRSGTVCGYSVS